MRLPLPDGAQAPPLPAAPRATVLIVDDNEANLLALRSALEPLGQRLVAASSGEEALRFLLHEECAVMLLDVQMPGMDGYEVARLLRERDRTRTTPVLFVTGTTPDMGALSQGYATGAVDFLLKPVPPDFLRTKVRVFVEMYLQRERLRQQEVELRRQAVLREAEAGLRQREADFRRLTENIPDLVLRYDGQRRHLFVNGQVERFSGAPPERFLGRTNAELPAPLWPAAALDAAVDAALEGREASLTLWWADASGGRRALQARVVPERDAGGAVLSALAVLRDVTEERRREEALQVLAETAELLASPLSDPGLLQRLVERLVPRLGTCAAVDLRHENGRVGRVALARARPLAPGTTDTAGTAGTPEAAGPPGGGGARLVADAEEGDGVPPAASAAALARVLATGEPLLREGPPGTGSVLHVPVHARGRALGVLTLHHGAEHHGAEHHGAEHHGADGSGAADLPGARPQARRHEGHEVALAQEVARRVGLALDNALLYREANDAQGRTARLQGLTAALSRALTPHEVARAVLDELRALEGMQAGILYLLQPDGALRALLDTGYQEEAIAPYRHVPAGAQTPSVAAARDGLPRWFGTPAELAAAHPGLAAEECAPGVRRATLPLVLEGRVLGSLCLAFTGERPFPATERELLQAVAHLAAQALERASLFETLREREGWLRLAAEATQVGTWDFLPQGGELRWDARARALFGVAADAPVSFEVWRACVHPEDWPQVERASLAALAAGALYQQEYRTVRPSDGEVRWVESRGQALLDAHGAPARFTGTTLDVTERKRTEARLRFLLDASRALAPTGGGAGGAGGAEGLLRAVVELASRSVATLALADLVEEGGGFRRIAVAHRDPVRQDDLARAMRMGPSAASPGSPLLLAAREGRTAFEPDLGPEGRARLATSPEHLALLERLAPHSMMTVPVHARGRVVALLTLAACAPQQRLDAGDVAMGEELARRAGAAVESALLVEETRRQAGRLRLLADASKAFASHADALEDAVRTVVQQVSEWLADPCVLALLEEGTGALQVVATHHPDPAALALLRETLPGSYAREGGLAARVVRTGRPLRVGEVPQEGLLEESAPASRPFLERYGLRSVLIVPLRAQGKVLGTLGVSRSRPDAPYTAEEQALLQELADRAALVVANARLLSATRAERQRAEEASRLKDEFLATVSHELRTPLTSMLGWVQMLRAGKLPAERQARALETVERNARAQAQLIEDLLDVSRIITGKLRLETEPLELSAVVQAAVDSVRPAAEARRLELEVQLEPAVGPLVGDAHRLQQVVWNLLSNAVKFTPEGGRVSVHLSQAGGEARVRVQDTGRGIRPDFLPHVFERFRQADGSSTRRYGGLGLGLSIVHHLVEMHGGHVEAHSEGEGTGATFTVRLPLAPARPDALLEGAGAGGGARVRGAEEEGAPSSLAGLSVLVVDDEPDVRELVTAMLEPRGVRVRTAASAEEALARLREAPCDVLLSDVAMPGEDGYQLVERVRRLPPEAGGRTPAVAMTAYARAEDRARALRAGFQLHLPKPLSPDELVAVLVLLSGRAPHARAQG
jgi:PAS domain S-box-containing protein